MFKINWFQVAPAMVLAFALSFSGYKIRMHFVDAAHAQELKDQKAALEKECKDDKAITTNTSRNFQDQIAALNVKLVAAKRVRSQCVPISIGPAGRRDASTGRAEPVGSNGISDQWLYDYAAEAERYRIQLTSCQKFIRDVWKAKGQ